MRVWNRMLLVGGLLAAGFLAGAASAAPPDREDDKANPPVDVTGTFGRPRSLSLPTEYADPAFNTYVDVAMLGLAWDQLDPVLMTDVAMQLAEGERVLYRPHKKFKADQCFELAAKMAAEKRDKATLERIAKAIEGRGNKELSAQVTAAQKLAATARSTDATLIIPVEECDAETFHGCQCCVQAVIAAKISGDSRGLIYWEKKLPDFKLSEKSRAAYAKLLTDTRSAMPKEGKPHPLADDLDRLTTITRSGLLDPNTNLADAFGGPRQPVQINVPSRPRGDPIIDFGIVHKPVVVHVPDRPRQFLDPNNPLGGLHVPHPPADIRLPSRSAPPPPIAPELRDPAFDRYFDAQLCARAIDSLDAEALCDSAFELSEAERILMRSHKLISSRSLMRQSVKVAVAKAHKATLIRVRSFAEKNKDEALTTEVAAAIKLAGTARAVDPSAAVSVTEFSTEQFATYKHLIHELEVRESLNDAPGLAVVIDEIKRSGLPEVQTTTLLKRAETIQKLITTSRSAESDQMSNKLSKLRDAARTVPVTVTINNQSAANIQVFWQNGANLQYYTTLSPGQFYTQQTYSGHQWQFVYSDGRSTTRLAPSFGTTWDLR